MSMISNLPKNSYQEISQSSWWLALLCCLLCTWVFWVAAYQVPALVDSRPNTWLTNHLPRKSREIYQRQPSAGAEGSNGFTVDLTFSSLSGVTEEGWKETQMSLHVCLASHPGKGYSLKTLALLLHPRVKIMQTFICPFFYLIFIWFFFHPLQLLQHLNVSQFCVSASLFYVFFLTRDNDSNLMYFSCDFIASEESRGKDSSCLYAVCNN